MKTTIYLFSLLLTIISTPVLAAAEMAGTIGNMSGALVVQRLDGTVKVLAPKSEVFAGDLLITAKNSYAQVNMNDGTQMTLRPNSNLRIEAYQFRKEAPKEDNVVLRLLKGGFRTITGMIGKRGNSDAYKLHASTSTIGVRGTDFTSRLCATKDCRDDEENTKPAMVKTQAAQAQVVGRVMLVLGDLSAKGDAGKERKLPLGSPVYEGDTLITGSKAYSVVAFRDESRVTLQENTQFVVEKFRYNQAKSEENAVLRLLKGGVRVVTGFIGRVNHDNYKFRLATATIGVRGTGFDAWCNGPCASGAATPVAALSDSPYGTGTRKVVWSQYAEATIDGYLNDAGMQTSVWSQYAEAPAGDPMDGAGVYVWAGEVVLISPGGSVSVALQQAAILARDTGKPIRIMVVPKSVLDNSAPRPDSIPLDMNKLFGSDANAGDAGLYVTVNNGNVIVTQGDQTLNLGSGETGFADGQLLMLLASMPEFMSGGMGIDPNGSPFSNPNGCMIGD